MTFLANPRFILQVSHASTLKWSVTGAHTIMLSKNINIHKVTKRVNVWFEFLWTLCYSSDKSYVFNFFLTEWFSHANWSYPNFQIFLELTFTYNYEIRQTAVIFDTNRLCKFFATFPSIFVNFENLNERLKKN